MKLGAGAVVALVVYTMALIATTACEKSATAITEVTFCRDTVTVHDTITVTVTDTLVCRSHRDHHGNLVCEKKKNGHD
jgi:hypothetical protein